MCWARSSVRKHLRAVDSVVLNTHPSPGQPKAKQNVLGPIIAVFALISSIYIGTINNGWKWFSWHPAGALPSAPPFLPPGPRADAPAAAAMLFAYVWLGANAALIKRVGGKLNTEIHGYMMSGAAIVAVFGWSARPVVSKTGAR
jgi:hypothetical protein